MESLLATIFLKIQDRIKTEVPEVKWVDQDFGQLEFYKERPAVVMPCVLIDMDDTDYEDESAKIQTGDAKIIIRLCYPAYTDAASVRQQNQKETALQYYNIEHKLNKALHTWCDDEFFTPMMRRKATTEKRDDNLRVRAIRYVFNFNDNTAMEIPVQIIDRPDLEIELD